MHSSVMIRAMGASFCATPGTGGLGLEPRLDDRVNELAHVTTKASNLANNGRRHEEILFGRSEEQCFDLGIEVAVHAGHLELVLEIRGSAQAPQEEAPAG